MRSTVYMTINSLNCDGSSTVMRLSVADIGHAAVSSPSVALGGLSCAAEQPPAQRDPRWRCCLLCSSTPPPHTHGFFFSPPTKAKARTVHTCSEGVKEVKPLQLTQHGNMEPSKSQRHIMAHGRVLL